MTRRFAQTAMATTAISLLCVASFEVEARMLTGFEAPFPDHQQPLQSGSDPAAPQMMTAPQGDVFGSRNVQPTSARILPKNFEPRSGRRSLERAIQITVDKRNALEEQRQEELASERQQAVFAPLTAPRASFKTPKNKIKEDLQEAVDLQADSLSHDENGVVIASGNVILVQAGRILRADEIQYFLEEDRVIARGDVVLNEATGDIYVANEIELTETLKNGYVQGLQTYLVDGSRFAAADGRRKDGIKTVMRGASYTPCEVCEVDLNKATPAWQIKADKVTYDEEDNRISYNNASFEFYGVPIAYTPYFSHPDGTVSQKSGFVNPILGLDSELGLTLGVNYYFALAPDKDLTLGLLTFTDENPMLTGQWRQRWDDASLELNAGLTYSQRTDRVSGEDITQDDEVRGYVFAQSLWDINQNWRTGLNIEYASDDQYLRQYDISSKDVLENQLFVERFSGRNYGVGRLLTFQDVRVRERREDQPEVLPEIIASFVGDPNSVPVIGGRWSFDTSFLGLRREGEDQDVNRLSFNAGWHRRFVSDTGLLTNVNANLRHDTFNTRDRETPLDDATEMRFFPQFHVQSSYPVSRDFEKYQVLLEPVAALTLAPNIDLDDDIPNEDSQDVQIDTSNLFEANRFPGLDAIEDQSRATYGFKTGIYGYEGSFISLFAGQSRRFDDDDNPFPEGSGLDEQESDYVGEVVTNYKNKYMMTYRTQLSEDSFSSERHEVDAFADFGRVQLGSRYLFAKALEGTDVDESREQLQLSSALLLSKDWRVRASSVHDFGDDPGLREALFGLDYFGQCWSGSIEAERNLTDDASGDSGTEIFFRIGLKNVAEFQKSPLSDNYRSDYSSRNNVCSRI